MNFIQPSVKEVFDTLTKNDQLIDFLKDKGLILTKQSLYEKFEKATADKMAAYVYITNVNMLYDLSETLVAYEEQLRSKQIWELLSNKVAWNDIASSLGIISEDLTGEIYKQILYCYKYCCVSSFFQNNKSTFMPESDFYEIEQNGAALGFYDALMKEFDKLDSVIGKCVEYSDYDTIPWDMINYLTQLLGFEKSTINADESNEEKFRELAKNILDIYRIKGTNYSYQLLFNFLGFNIEIKEYYFDRRLYHTTNSAGNSETSSTNNSDYEYYLTVHNPTDNNLENIGIDETVMPSDISTQYSLHEFNELCREYGPAAVLGYSPTYNVTDSLGNVLDVKEYTGKVYKYFKTNLIYYSVGLDKANLTEKQIIAVTKYLDFLTPSYVMREIELKTYIEKTSENIGFDGDGTKIPDAYGNYDDFEMLDSEDWEQSYQDEFVKTENRNLIYVDENNYDGENETYKKYENSIKDGKFRLPLGYSIKRASLSKHLTGGTGTNYLSRKRTKYYIYYQSSSSSFSYDSENVVITPYYTIPPFVGKTNYQFIDYKFYEQTNSVNLLGGDGNGGESCVKTQIRDANLRRVVDFVTDKTVSEFVDSDNKFNELTYGKTNARTMVSEKTIKYGPNQAYRSAFDAYSKELKNYHICNIASDGLTFSTDIYKESDLLSYYKHDDILKSLSLNNYFLSYSGTLNNGYLRLYRYGSYPYPVKNSNYETTYLNYLKSFKYVLKKAYNGSIGENIAISGSYISKISLSAAKETVNNYYNKMIEAVENNPNDSSKWYNLNYIENKTFYIIANGEYYKVVKEPAASKTASNTYSASKKTHIFNSLSEALKHFEKYPTEKINNAEFYIKDDGLYCWYYKNRVGNKLIFSEKDEKLYKVIGNSKYDILDYDNFYGSLTIKRYKKIENLTKKQLSSVTNVYVEGYNGINYSGLTLNGFETDGLMYEYKINDSAINGRQKYVLDDSGDLVKCYIDDYDACWEGYDEEADEEDFVFYNSNHIVSWDVMGINNEVISRPVKYVTDKNFDSDLSTATDYYNYLNSSQKNNSSFNKIEDSTKYYSTIGQKIIKEISENTIDNFTDKEKINWGKSYNYYPITVGSVIRTSPAIVYEKNSAGDMVATTDTVAKKGKIYYSYSCIGLLSIIEENIERITGVSYDREFDYYSSLSSFFQDYYRMVILGDFNKLSVPSKILNDLGLTSVTSELINNIKYYYTVAITQIAGVLDTITKDRVYYQYIANWKSLVSGNLSDNTKFPDWKDEYLSDPLNSIADSQNRVEHVYGSGKHCYYFNEKTSFINLLLNAISKLNVNFGSNYRVNGFEGLLGFDAYSLKKINNFEEHKNYKYYYKDYRKNIVEKSVKDAGNNNAFYLVHDSNYNFFIPYSLNYGLNNYSKDFYNKHKEIYSEFTELLDLLNTSDKEKINDFLKQYSYNKLTNLYREAQIQDTYPLGVKSDGKKPMRLMPKLAEKFDGKAGQFKSPGTLLSSYYNNGGENDKPISLKFFKFELSVDSSKSATMKFYINRSDFINSFGYDFSRYYMKKDLSTVNGFTLRKELKTAIELMYKKQFTNVRPVFYYYNEFPTYYNVTKLSTWQTIKSAISKDYVSANVDLVDENYKSVADSDGNIVDENGDIIIESDTNHLRQRIADGQYIILTITDSESLLKFNNPEMVFSINGVGKEEEKNIYGFLNIRKLTQKYIDNYISFPQSLDWVERDDNDVASEYISFGDDRAINITINNKLFLEYIFEPSTDARVFYDKEYYVKKETSEVGINDIVDVNGDIYSKLSKLELSKISNPAKSGLYSKYISYNREYYNKYIRTAYENKIHDEEVVKCDSNKFPYVYDGNKEVITKVASSKYTLEDQGFKPVYINTYSKDYIKLNADNLKKIKVIDGEEKIDYMCDNIYYDPDGNLILKLNNDFLHTSNIKNVKLIYTVLFLTVKVRNIIVRAFVKNAKVGTSVLTKAFTFNALAKFSTVKFVNTLKSVVGIGINSIGAFFRKTKVYAKYNKLVNSKAIYAKGNMLSGNLFTGMLVNFNNFRSKYYLKTPKVFKKINVLIKSLKAFSKNTVNKALIFTNINEISKKAKSIAKAKKADIKVLVNIVLNKVISKAGFSQGNAYILSGIISATKAITFVLTFVSNDIIYGFSITGPIATTLPTHSLETYGINAIVYDIIMDDEVKYNYEIDDKVHKGLKTLYSIEKTPDVQLFTTVWGWFGPKRAIFEEPDCETIVWVVSNSGKSVCNIAKTVVNVKHSQTLINELAHQKEG